MSATKLQGIHWPIYPCQNDWWGRALLPEILGQADPVWAKSPVFNLFSLAAPQPQHIAKSSV